MEQWAAEHKALLWWLGAASLASFVITAFAVPLLVARMPADHYRRPPGTGWAQRHPALRVARSVLGAVVVLVGVFLLFVPGQGILTILVGLGLLEFPGKRRLELGLLRRPRVHAAVDWMRRRAGRPPLEL